MWKNRKLFLKVNKIDKTLARFTKEKSRIKITKIRKEWEDSTTDSTEIKRPIGEFYE